MFVENKTTEFKREYVDDEMKEMGKPFETDESKKIRSLDLVNEDRTYSGFAVFSFW